MISAVDTNVLLDVLLPNPKYVQWALDSLTSYDEIVICEVVFAELASQFQTSDQLKKFLRNTGISLPPSTNEALIEAASAWKAYSARRRGAIVCPSCGKGQSPICHVCGTIIQVRQHILSDFLIGGHAKLQAERLITRDRGF